jgi:hypothetical protein
MKKCPFCETEDYYEGFLERDCGNPSCKLFKERPIEIRIKEDVNTRTMTYKDMSNCEDCYN